MTLSAIMTNSTFLFHIVALIPFSFPYTLTVHTLLFCIVNAKKSMQAGF